MEDICHAAEVPGSRGSRAARRPLLRQGAKARDTPSRKMLFLNRSVYFSRRFVDGILNQCHVFTGALLIMPSPRGLAHGEVYISAADAQLHTCGCDSLQTLGSGGLVLSPVWLTPGTSERHSTHCWWSYTHTYTHTHTHTNKSFLKNTPFTNHSLWKALIASYLMHCEHVHCSAPSSAAPKWLQMFALFNSCTRCYTFIYPFAL